MCAQPGIERPVQRCYYDGNMTPASWLLCNLRWGSYLPSGAARGVPRDQLEDEKPGSSPGVTVKESDYLRL